MSQNPPPPRNSSEWQAQSIPSENEHQQAQFPGNQPGGFKPTLTQDEIRVLKECNNESFYYRCVPLSTLFSGLAFIGMKQGYLKKSPTYGYGPKMFFGALLGYVGGKISYQSACAEKIMRLPNSSLAESLRKRKGQVSYQESAMTEPGFSYGSPSAEYNKDIPMLEERGPDLSEHEEGNDSYQKVKESLSPYSESEEAAKENKFASYDDLRKENREDYATKISEKYRKHGFEPSRSASPPSGLSESPHASNTYPDDYRSASGSVSETKPDPYFNPKKNKYGDVWDD